MPRGGFREGNRSVWGAANVQKSSKIFKDIQTEIKVALSENQSESIFSQREIKDFIRMAYPAGEGFSLAAPSRDHTETES